MQSDLAVAAQSRHRLEEELSAKRNLLRQLQQQSGQPDGGGSLEDQLRATVRHKLDEVVRLRIELEHLQRSIAKLGMQSEKQNLSGRQLSQKNEDELRKILNIIDPLRDENYEIRAEIEVERTWHTKMVKELEEEKEKLGKCLAQIQNECVTLKANYATIFDNYQAIRKSFLEVERTIEKLNREKLRLVAQGEALWSERAMIAGKLSNSKINLEKAGVTMIDLRNEICNLENVTAEKVGQLVNQNVKEQNSILELKEQNFFQLFNPCNSQRLRFTETISQVEELLQKITQQEKTLSARLSELEKEKEELLSSLNELRVREEMTKQMKDNPNETINFTPELPVLPSQTSSELDGGKRQRKTRKSKERTEQQKSESSLPILDRTPTTSQVSFDLGESETKVSIQKKRSKGRNKKGESSASTEGNAVEQTASLTASLETAIGITDEGVKGPTEQDDEGSRGSRRKSKKKKKRSKSGRRKKRDRSATEDSEEGKPGDT